MSVAIVTMVNNTEVAEMHQHGTDDDFAFQDYACPSMDDSNSTDITPVSTFEKKKFQNFPKSWVEHVWTIFLRSLRTLVASDHHLTNTSNSRWPYFLSFSFVSSYLV